MAQDYQSSQCVPSGLSQFVTFYSTVLLVVGRLCDTVSSVLYIGDIELEPGTVVISGDFYSNCLVEHDAFHPMKPTVP